MPPLGFLLFLAILTISDGLWRDGPRLISANTTLIKRHHLGDLFLSDDYDTGGSCTKGFCQADGRRAAQVSWKSCTCQCLPTSPVFRDDTGHCVNSVYGCKLVPFRSAVAAEYLPVLVVPSFGQLIYPEAEMHLDGVADFPSLSCHVFTERYLSQDGWVLFNNETKPYGLAFQLVQKFGKIFLQFVGSETVKLKLVSRLFLVEFSCKTRNGANVVPRPCAAFRFAGLPEDYHHTSDADSISVCKWRTWIVIGFASGLLGVTYIMAVMIYLMVRQRHRKKFQREDVMEVPKKKTVSEAQAHFGQQHLSKDERAHAKTSAEAQTDLGAARTSCSHKESSDNQKEFISPLRFAWTVATSRLLKFKFRNIRSKEVKTSNTGNASTTTLDPTGERTSSSANCGAKTIIVDGRRCSNISWNADSQKSDVSWNVIDQSASNISKNVIDQRASDISRNVDDQSSSNMSRSVDGQKYSALSRKSHRKDKSTSSDTHESVQGHRRYNYESCSVCQPSSPKPSLLLNLSVRGSEVSVESKRKSVSFDPTLTEHPLDKCDNNTKEQSPTSKQSSKEEVFNGTSFLHLTRPLNCWGQSQDSYVNNWTCNQKSGSQFCNSIAQPRSIRSHQQSRPLASILKRTKSSDDLQALPLTREDHLRHSQHVNRAETLRGAGQVTRPMVTVLRITNDSKTTRQDFAVNREMRPHVEDRVPVKSLVETFNKKTTEGQKSVVSVGGKLLQQGPASKGPLTGSVVVCGTSLVAHDKDHKQMISQDDSGYQSSDSELAEVKDRCVIRHTEIN